mmetsp:Transcript_19711/g.27523  ORF Transcript_19711/g.27523 Transcript_19711/m.27523 type:complete len:114 (+) Transcript_19711:363-704(+)|eukprot:CAMPEP_0184485512 /NCGR_PEP_ID=MMETSP0113_2-20130426/7106_1 /TAXON_ID=91329 /ORGANISM="Norrisiella sphaerica, Strain BC52" /LENGTH=113 /DNA_ID=CAMNT_0026866981 /DNA_START=191 /DNA_END=532 /DNA_ORIENTATION=+
MGQTCITTDSTKETSTEKLNERASSTLVMPPSRESSMIWMQPYDPTTGNLYFSSDNLNAQSRKTSNDSSQRDPTPLRWSREPSGIDLAFKAGGTGFYNSHTQKGNGEGYGYYY